MTKVFVYGSLKRGFSNHHILEGSKFLGERIIHGFQLYGNHAFPMVKRGPGIVKGEVYEVDKFTLQELDWLEGHPIFYTREKIDDVYIYLKEPYRHMTYIPEGVWNG